MQMVLAKQKELEEKRKKKEEEALFDDIGDIAKKKRKGPLIAD